ncbi:hypothetical protein CDD83_5981 [Cordyceps sp. RAO-2017]|nr:hypothetical protein CDD83_5981 [Cordyceps sp. RAO-2017]
MAYNPRMSIIPAAQQQHQQGRSSRKKEEEADAFMRLPDREIVGCITDIGINFSVADLQKPSPGHVQQIFEWFAELLLNATRETVEPAMRAAAEEVCGDWAETVPVETRNLMGFYAALRRLLVECGVHDFGFGDLYRPSHERLVKIFSYLINFVRFRESQTAVIDAHFNRTESAKARIEALHGQRADGEAPCDELRRRRPDLARHIVLAQDYCRRGDRVALFSNGVRTFVAHLLVASRAGRREVLELADDVRRSFRIDIDPEEPPSSHDG